MAPVKVLLAGGVRGSFQALFDRVEAVNKKSGPFHILLCVGGFFEPSDDNEGDVPSELAPYISGGASLPVPTYFIGGCGKGSKATLLALQQHADAGGDDGAAGGLHYLGRRGLREVHGLSVAFLDGTYQPQTFTSEDRTAAEWPCCRHYTSEDVGYTKRLLERAAGDVDVLLSCEWPAGVLEALPEAPSLPGLNRRSMSSQAAELAVLARPRYHVASGQPAFYARPPYASKDLGAGPRATRFVGLAHVANQGKLKFLHALALEPALQMSPEQLCVVPEGSTPSPFEGGGASTSGGKRGAAEEEENLDSQPWRWQPAKRQRGGGRIGGGSRGGGAAGGAGDGGERRPRSDPACTVYVRNITYEAVDADIERFFSQAGQVAEVRRGQGDDGRPLGWALVVFASSDGAQAAVGLSGQMLLSREVLVEPARGPRGAPAGGATPPSGKPVESCWFCLSSPQVDINLVASIGNECYLALDKGPITPHHALVVPIEHLPNSASLPPAAAGELDQYLSALRSFHAASGRVLVGFERYLTLRSKGGNHCHTSVLGVARAAGEGARALFERLGKEAGLEEPQEVPLDAQGCLDRSVLHELAGRNEYLLWLLPDGSGLLAVLRSGQRAPINLGREALAQLAGTPERADWRACGAASPEAEAAATEAFKAAFKAYDPTLQAQG